MAHLISRASFRIIITDLKKKKSRTISLASNSEKDIEDIKKKIITLFTKLGKE